MIVRSVRISNTSSARLTHFGFMSFASMAGSDRSDAGRRAGDKVRRRIGGSGLQARNTQAARDALRRRQKEKKARIVKRHVRYKDKKKLLEQLTRSERPAPIVAKELCRDEEEDFEGTQDHPVESKTPTTQEEDGVEAGGSLVENDQREQIITGNADVDPNVRTDLAPADDGQDDDSIRPDISAERRKKKYVPFMKEQKEYERIKQEREAEENERRRKIEEREQMLERSKKQRRAKAKQVRKITPRGQPKLKHQLDAMLARIQKQ